MKNAGANKKKNREEKYSLLMHFENKNICFKQKNIKFILKCVIIEEVCSVECVITHFKRGLINQFIDLWHYSILEKHWKINETEVEKL